MEDICSLKMAAERKRPRHAQGKRMYMGQHSPLDTRAQQVFSRIFIFRKGRCLVFFFTSGRFGGKEGMLRGRMPLRMPFRRAGNTKGTIL
jgi:hypothetical protein